MQESVLTKEEQISMLECMRRLIYSKDHLTQEDRDFLHIIRRVTEENKKDE